MIFSILSLISIYLLFGLFLAFTYANDHEWLEQNSFFNDFEISSGFSYRWKVLFVFYAFNIPLILFVFGWVVISILSFDIEGFIRYGLKHAWLLLSLLILAAVGRYIRSKILPEWWQRRLI